jgi:hypothetical protein
MDQGEAGAMTWALLGMGALVIIGTLAAIVGLFLWALADVWNDVETSIYQNEMDGKK